MANNSDSSESSGLHKIQSCEDLDCRADIIFVHGLGGNSKSTWHPKELTDNDDFWLKWLGDDLSYINTWTFGYEAEPSSWRGNSMPLFDQSTNLLQWLENKGIGERSIIFVTHSLGGLLVKKMLQTAQTYKKKKIIKNTKGIVFLATPHTGSDLANLIDNIGIIARTTVSVKELKTHQPQLRELNNWYREQVASFDVQTKVFYETKKVSAVRVVDPDSANPGIQGVLPIAVEEDHISIAKPNRDSSVYLGVKRFIEELKAQIQGSPGDNTTRSFAPQPDLVLNVGIISPDAEPWNQRATTLEYKTQRTADGINVSPLMEYLDRYTSGGPIEPIAYDWEPFTWDFPNLDLKIVNNSHRTVFLTEVRFDIERSQPNLTPILLIQPDSYGNNAMHFWVKNQGWGLVRNLKARFHLTPLGQGTDEVAYAEPFPYEVAVEDFEEGTNINIASAFEACGVNLSAAQKLSVDRDDPLDTFQPELDDLWGPFTQNGAIISGELTYNYSDVDHQEHSYAVKFSTIVHIFDEHRMGLPMPPTYQYAVKFDVEQMNYQRCVSVSHVLKPGEADRFNIKIGVDRSSVHSFKLSLLHNDAQELVSPKITMSTFIPRSGVQYVDNSEAPEFFNDNA